ncbi:Glycosyltransferase AglD [uncultured archaeon]|nr:Glycosyltransferase AglD [uncultured archaeon]
MYSIIIPAYNESDRIKSVLVSYAAEFSGQEIIVVFDGQDTTPDIVEDVADVYPDIRLLTFHKRLGKGGAIIEGFRAARGDKIGFVDADESVSPKDLKSMFETLGEVDGVIASRKLATSKIIVNQSLRRRLASKGFNMLVRTVFGLPFKDTQCGAKVFIRKAICDIIGELETSGFEIDVEILWRLKNKGYRVVESPITWSHSEGSKFKLCHSFAMFSSLIKLRFQKFSLEYKGE